VQVTEAGFSGMLCLSNKQMKLYVLAGGSRSGGPRQILEVDLAKLVADVEAKSVKPAAVYTRICGTIPSTLQVDGNMGLDANDDYMYFSVKGPETAQLSPGQTLLPDFGPRFKASTSGLRSMNLKTGEIKFIVNVGFGIGHVQSNPWNPGEVVFCWETGGKAQQRTWIINADGTGLRGTKYQHRSAIKVRTPSSWRARVKTPSKPLSAA
jgi:oligogalacturonide lyase